MSCVFVVVPIVAGSWPLISAAIVAASAGLGYRALQGAEASLKAAGQAALSSVDLSMDDSQVVADTLMRGDSFVVDRGDIRATFRVDGRGHCTVHIDGQGKSQAELRVAGEELMDRVRQQFAYSKVMAELEERGFEVVQEQVEADRSIRIKVRRWS